MAQEKFFERLREERLKELYSTRDKLKAIRPKYLFTPPTLRPLSLLQCYPHPDPFHSPSHYPYLYLRDRTLKELQEAFQAGLAAMDELSREDMGYELEDLNAFMTKLNMGGIPQPPLP